MVVVSLVSSGSWVLFPLDVALVMFGGKFVTEEHLFLFVFTEASLLGLRVLQSLTFHRFLRTSSYEY